MITSIRRLALATAITFMTLAATLGYWQLVRAPQLVQRDDNPRLVLAERAIVRGSIFDRNGETLALTRLQDEELIRYYPEPLAEPLVGYYSLQHGTAWAEAAFDARLRGTEGKSDNQLWWDRLLHKPQIGQAVTLTLDMQWQRAAYDALGLYAGTALVADLHTGQILAMASRPIYDPNSLDADWERLKNDPSAPLLNRAVQGEYQPGSLFQTVVMEEALRAGLITLTETVTAPAASVVISGTTLGCALSPRGATWADVYSAGCPGPFAQLAERISLPALEQDIRRWQLDTPVDIGLWAGQATTQTVQMPEQALQELVLGQGAFTLTPLHVLRVLLTLANDGRAVPLSAVALSAKQPDETHVFSAEDAALLRSAWQQECGLNGLAGLAVSGSHYLAWYMGTGPASAGNPEYAIVILVENASQAPLAHDAACQLARTFQP